MRSLLILVACALPGIAAAQPADPSVPAIPADRPAPPLPTASPAQRDYDEAFAALLAGRMATAIAGFDRVATAATGDLAASAAELGRLARQLQARRVRFVVAAAPSDPPATAPITDAPDDGDQKSSGRVSFVVYSTLAGIYAGATLVDVSDVDDFRTGTLMLVGSTGAGFLASWLASRDRDISPAMADSYATGLLVGVGNGLLLASPLGLDSSEEVLGIGLAGMAVGGALGLGISDRARPTVGQSIFVSTMGVMGFATTGLGMLVVANDNLDEDVALGLLAGGLDAGAAAGMAIAPRLTWSRSRARLTQLGALLGGLAGLGVAAIITGEPDSDSEARLMAAATLGGMWAGFGAAVKLTDDMSPDPRFAAAGADSLAVAPAMIRDAPGLLVGGRF